MKSVRATLGALACALVLLCGAAAAAPPNAGRIFVLMVWDGLRPDLVTQRDTPNLFRMAREGVRFDRYHSEYPTLTMVNGATLATGAGPALDGILGNVMYFAPLLHPRPGDSSDPLLAAATDRPARLENTRMLMALNGPDALAGRLVGLDTVVQEVQREGGYTAVIGKAGPAFLFDDRVGQIGDGHDPPAHGESMFVNDDMAAPVAIADEVLPRLAQIPDDAIPHTPLDEYFTRLLTDKALPAAARASAAGKPALIVLWQHDPDFSQHRAGLGTLPALEALGACDRNLGRIRAALGALGLENRTDLMVLSDHGFATIRMKVQLADLLVSMGLKESRESTEVVVAQNAGSDFIYLSRGAFGSREARRDRLQKIVNFAAAQEWCGPIFSAESSPDPRKSRLGWIDGTFAESVVGLFNPARAPDLVLSFRELSELDNSALTGPEEPAFKLGARGQESVPNRSKPLVRPVKGVIYADPGGKTDYTTGMGMHGAAGARELHAFLAAVGPDFRAGFVDRSPTGTPDVAPTMTSILGLRTNVGPHAAYPSGRTMNEALADDGRAADATRTSSVSTRLELQGMAVVSTLKFLRVGEHTYLDDAQVQHIPLGHSP